MPAHKTAAATVSTCVPLVRYCICLCASRIAIVSDIVTWNLAFATNYFGIHCAYKYIYASSTASIKASVPSVRILCLPPVLLLFLLMCLQYNYCICLCAYSMAMVYACVPTVWLGCMPVCLQYVYGVCLCTYSMARVYACVPPGTASIYRCLY